MPPQDLVDDRRQFERRLWMQPAFVRTSVRKLYCCMVVDVSENGALLDFESTAPVDDRFQLVTNTWQGTLECEVVHRSLHGIGVQFQLA